MSKNNALLERSRDPFRPVKIIIASLVALVFVFPIIWMIFVSLKPQDMAVANVLDWFAPPFTIANYIEVLAESDVLLWLWNSVFIALVTTVLTLIVTSLAAFAISKMQFRYKGPIFLFFLAGMMVPGEATIIPLFEIVKNMNMLDTYAGLILPMVASPIGVIILKSFFDGVPQEVIERDRKSVV